MKVSAKSALIVAGITLFGSAFASPKVIGSWKGKIHLIVPKMPDSNPQMKAMIEKQLATLANLSILLNVKPDHTYSTRTQGGPSSVPNKESTGKWSTEGTTITLKSSDPKAPKEGQKLTVSANGKTMTLTLPRGQGSVIFTK